MRTVSAAAINHSNITALFSTKVSPKTEIYFPTDPDYANVTTQRWSVYEQPSYVASIKPASESDVQAIVIVLKVRVASANGIPFLATGGGHGLSVTLHELQNGIEIDLSAFKNVTVDPEANTITVGGANVFGDVVEPLWNAKRESPTGSCACVGFVGGGGGGGVGRLEGLHGLVVDNMLSFTVVTATGDLVTASATENPDLFWAMRGATPNFGIVLWATYRIFPLTNNGNVLNADFVFPASANKSHFEILKTFEKNQPAALSFMTDVRYTEEYNGTNILFNAVYYGPEEEGIKLLQPFIDNGPITKNITMTTWNKIIDTSLYGLFGDAQCVKGKHINSYTVDIKTMDIPTFEAHFSNISRMFENYPDTRASTWFIEGLPLQAARQANSSATSFPPEHRQSTNLLLWGYNYDNNDIDEEINEFAKNARSEFAKTSGLTELEVYVSYGHGDEGPKAWYGSSLKRLQQLKRKWDPKNVFHFMNPIVAA
ncbi:uncharacterized protein K452DRAFT_239649 [Aplosporella prunicola CBS 121167]|uniref:FAD-binding PCMH-type domain-containing protein n=1 Tax=Aplosporella prunicola CBS 121167 TaxID=1176127 RepID=A0A6A6AUJ7_9PEZI|nr:uncharacterized protein K452DRAFT_239649 [Aplosporella prunicola CBS 121167]KAF2135276.1 hypothetical protein K452DRAFT_239649 [Aplosporella prunicola CBS 121167]